MGLQGWWGILPKHQKTILKHPKTMKVKADHHRKSNCKKGLLFKHVETINQLHIGFLLENYIYPVGVNPCAFRSNEIERKRRDRLASAGTAPEADGKHWTTTTTRTTTTTTTTTTTNNNNKQQPTNKKQQTTNNKTTNNKQQQSPTWFISLLHLALSLSFTVTVRTRHATAPGPQAAIRADTNWPRRTLTPGQA